MIGRTIEVAGIRLRFRGDDAVSPLLDRYAAFACAPRPGSEAVDVEVLARSPNAGGSWSDQSLVVAERDGTVVFEGGGLYAEVSPDRMAARVAAPPAERAIDAVVRFLLSSHLARTGGVLVHASAVRIGAGAWVFAGPSGAGKTTLATTLDGDLFCDEAVALYPRDGGVDVCSTPYWRATPDRAPVAGLVFPAVAPDAGAPPRWRALTTAQAVARLLPQVGPLMGGPTAPLLDTVARCAGSVMCAEVSLSALSQVREWLQPRLEVESPPGPAGIMEGLAQ